MKLRVFLSLSTCLIWASLDGAYAKSSLHLLGQPLFKKISTVEGPIPQPVYMEDSSFCNTYLCIGSHGIGDINTGDSGWFVASKTADSSKVLDESYAGRFYPEVTLTYERNVIKYTELVFDTAVRSKMVPATLNLLGNFTRLVLGAPISGQKLAACYQRLKTEPVCTVGGGKIRLVGGTAKTFKAWFRVRDDAGDINVIYAIELDD